MSVANPVIDHIDALARRIYLKTGVRTYHPVEDIYAEVVNLRANDETLRGYYMFVTAGGNLSKGGGKATPRYAIFQDCKIVPADEDHDLRCTGEQLYADAAGELVGSGPSCFDKTLLSPTSQVNTDYTPADAEIVYVYMPSDTSIALKYGGRIIVDVDNGESGTTYPVGTLANPVNNAGDALALSLKYNAPEFYILSTFDVDRDYMGKRFTGGSLNAQVNIVGQHDLSGSMFSKVGLAGDMNGSLVRIEGCSLGNVSNIDGMVIQSGLTGVVHVAANCNLVMAHCFSQIPGSSSPVLDMHAGQPVSVSVRGFSGGLRAKHCDHASDVGTFEFMAGKMHIDATCTDGYMSVRGLPETAVNDYTSGSNVTIDTTALFSSKPDLSALPTKTEMVNYIEQIKP